MPTIGILLPGSTLYPSIGMDLLQGIRSCLEFHHYENVAIEVSLIGYGIKNDEIYNAAEKLLVVHDAAVVIAFMEDYHAAKLSPLFAAAGKLLIISNAGTNYPREQDPPVSHTLFHSLNDCLCCYLTGTYAAKHEGGTGAIMAASFHDGGYNHTHAMSNGFALAGGEIKHNFVSHFRKEEFNTDNLVAFIKETPEVKKMLGVFSGDMARYFFENLSGHGNELRWYGSPMMFDTTPGDFAEPKPAVPGKMTGYTNWVPQLPNEANRSFVDFYKTNNGKEANIFSLQGWETGLLLMAYLAQRGETMNTGEALEKLYGISMDSPRGNMTIHNKYTLAPAHLVTATGNLEVEVESRMDDTSNAWEEMLAQVPAETFSSWRNTYLCI